MARDLDDAAEFARSHRNRWMNWGIPLIAVAVLFGGLVLYASVAGKKAHALGEPCETSRDCGARGLCVVAAEGSTCTRYCEQAGDCPGGWICEAHEELNQNGDWVGTMTRACAKR